MKKGFTIVAALAAILAATAAPAGAAGHAATALECGWNGSEALFSSVETLSATGVAARGDDITREPSLNEVYETMPASAAGKGKPAKIPVRFHVISPNGSTANVTQEQIDAQITVMNLAFSGFYGGVDTRFRFELASVTRSVNADWFYAGPGSPAEREMKQALWSGDLGELNFYSTSGAGYLGWAYLPGLTEPRQYLDGIVVHWESMVGTSTRFAGRYDEGKTAVHEAGHWLDLEHTFYGGCNANGDYVADTPAMKVPTSGCPEGKDTCTRDPGLDPVHNYMDYSYDSCYWEFTAGQAARMQDAHTWFRAG